MVLLGGDLFANTGLVRLGDDLFANTGLGCLDTDRSLSLFSFDRGIHIQSFICILSNCLMISFIEYMGEALVTLGESNKFSWIKGIFGGVLERTERAERTERTERTDFSERADFLERADLGESYKFGSTIFWGVDFLDLVEPVGSSKSAGDISIYK